MWWISLLGVIIGGVLVGIFSWLTNRYVIQAEHKKWLLRKRAKLAEEMFKTYNELSTYFSFQGLKELPPYVSVSEKEVGELFRKSRELSSNMFLYFDEEIYECWMEVTMKIREISSRLVEEIEKIMKGEEPSEEVKEFFAKMEKMRELMRKKLRIK